MNTTAFGHQVLGEFRRFYQRMRIAGFNRHKFINISPEAWLSPSVKIQMSPGGVAYGGSIRIAAGARVLDGVILAPYGGSILLEEDTFIGPYTVLYGHGGLSIRKKTAIAAHCVIIPSNHTFERLDVPIFDQPSMHEPIEIGEGVWIGTGAKILAGASIGHGCVVAAGAVVTKPLPPLSVAVGVPARIVRNRADRRPSEVP